jgi:hypothetical protein
MEKLSQEYILSVTFNHSIEREELLVEKYSHYVSCVKDAELLDIIKESKKNAREHTKMLREKMIKLNIQG